MHGNRTDTVFHFQFVLFPFFDGFDAFATGDTGGNFFNVPKKLPDCFHRPRDQDVALKLHLPSKPRTNIKTSITTKARTTRSSEWVFLLLYSSRLRGDQSFPANF